MSQYRSSKEKKTTFAATLGEIANPGIQTGQLFTSPIPSTNSIAVNPIDGAEVVIGIVAAVVEGQQGRVFEREHREGRHQGIGQGDFNLARPRVRKRGETRAERPEKGVGGEVLPCFTGSKCHGEPLHWPKW